MPGINGIEAAQKIREQDGDCCIIFLTAFDEFAYARSAITVRALDYLLKPYDEQELMLVLEEAMRLTEARMGEKAVKEQMAAGTYSGTGSDGRSASVDEGEDFSSIRLSRVAEIIDKYIHENYMFDISMQDMARMMNYSEAYFCKLFKQCFHKNFTSYLTEFRVAEAKKMLEEPTVNVKEIGKAVGYADSNYFAKVFKRITGQSPTEYRMVIFQRV